MEIKVEISALALAQDAIISSVDTDTIQRLKAIESSPKLRAYAIGHPGKAVVEHLSNDRKHSFGARVLKFYTNTISAIRKKIKSGIPVFHTHAKQGEPLQRNMVGEVVGGGITPTEYGDTAYATIYYFPTATGIENYDVASMESTVVYGDDEPDGSSPVVDIGPITAVAVGDSRVDKPGFPGAQLLGTVAAMAPTKGIYGSEPGKEVKVTLTELKAAIKEGKFTPTDLFDESVIDADATVTKLTRAANQTGYESQRNQMSKEIRELEKKIEEAEKKAESATDYRTEALNGRVNGLFEAEATKRKLTDVQKSIVQRELALIDYATLENDEESTLQKKLTEVVDSGLKTAEELVKLVGGNGNGAKEAATPTTPTPAPNQAATPTTTAPTYVSKPETDLLDPAKNPFIPKD